MSCYSYYCCCCYHAVCLYFDAHLSNFAFCLLLLDYILYMTYIIPTEADFLFVFFLFNFTFADEILTMMMRTTTTTSITITVLPLLLLATTTRTIRPPAMYQINNNMFASDRVLKSLKATSRMRIQHTST